MEDENARIFEDLVNEGNNLLESCGWDGSGYEHSPRAEEYTSLLYRGMDIISKTFGNNSSYYIGLDRISSDEKKSVSSSYYAHCFGIIKGAYLAYKRSNP